MAASTTLKGNFTTKIYNILAGTAGAADFPNASEFYGTKLRSMTDYFESTTAYDAGSEIKMGYVPKGAHIVGFVVANEAVGAAVTADIKVGSTAATAAEAWTDMTSANQQFIPAVEAVRNAALTADSYVTVVTAAATLAANKRIRVTTLYEIED